MEPSHWTRERYKKVTDLIQFKCEDCHCSFNVVTKSKFIEYLVEHNNLLLNKFGLLFCYTYQEIKQWVVIKDYKDV